MTEDEMIDNLGTIARSGSKAFVKHLADSGSSDTKPAAVSTQDSIIGQFGVGFYSVFMVCNKVNVYSMSAYGGQGHFWTSDGTGSYDIANADGVTRGTKVVVDLKDTLIEEFADNHRFSGYSFSSSLRVALLFVFAVLGELLLLSE